MSARTSTQVTSVAAPAVTASALGTAVVAAGIIALIVKGLSAGAKAAYVHSTKTLNKHAEVVRSAASLQVERQTLTQNIDRIVASARLSDVEATKVSVLATAASLPYRLANPEALRSVLKTVETARSVVEVRQAEAQLLRTLEVQHEKVFVKTLTLACERATIAAGFPTVEVSTGVRDKVRLVGTNAAGHALVTEIDVSPRREPSIASEIFGVTDGTCNGILDSFEEAFAREGVRGTPPKRELTGGVCELEATLDFIGKKVRRTRPQVQAATTPEDPEEERRLRRVNSQRVRNQR